MQQLIEQFKQLFSRLTVKQRIAVGVAAIAAVAGLVMLQQWNAERGFAPLFTGLAAEDAGAITAQLQDSLIEYRLSDNGATILVREKQVAEVRLQLASAGLPETGRIGFELFDQTNFGASEFTEQVNYHRAIEGELERSVMSIAAVERARVHITMPKESLYTTAREPAKASILVKLRARGELTPQNIAAITHLAASAVTGLNANQVTLLDTDGNLLNRPASGGLDDSDPGGEAALEYRQTIEREIQQKVAQSLAPLVGAGKFRIGVSAEVDRSSGEQSEELFNPDASVIVASNSTEDVPGNLVGQGGTPGTASNLPRTEANSEPLTPVSAGASAGRLARRTEQVSYQTSRTVRRTTLRPGGIRRLSLSVLVDHSLRYENGQPVVEPPSPELLQVIRDVTGAAIGLDDQRGDQLVVEAFPFEETLSARPIVIEDEPGGGSAPTTLPIELPQWLVDLVGESSAMIVAVGIGAGFALLLLGAGVFFWKRRKKMKEVQIAAELEARKKKKLSAADDATRTLEERLAEQSAEMSRKEAEAILALKVPEVSTKKTDVLTKHIRAEIKKDPAALAHVIRSWLNGEYQR